MGNIIQTGPGIDQVATTAFRCTVEIDQIGQRLKDALGAGANYVPARLAIARSLAIPEPPALPSGEAGRTIRGENLFGTGEDLSTWLSLLVEHAGRPVADLSDLQALVRAHWARGMRLLADVLEEASGDAFEFKRRLAEAALPLGPARSGNTSLAEGDAAAGVLEPVPLVISIGEVGQDTATGEPFAWPLNGPGGSPHAAFIGGVGSGKTRTASFMLRAIRERTPVPLIAFDFKGDLTDANNRLDEAFRATVIDPPHRAVPIDVLALADRSRTGTTLAAQRLRDSLGTLKGAGFGPVQKGLLGDAAERALASHAPCRLPDVLAALRHVYADKDRKEDGAIASLADLCRFSLFDPQLSPSEFFSRSWIIRLTSDLPDLVKISIVTLITDALDRHLNTLADAPVDDRGNRALRIVCVIDEAHRILGVKLPGLSGLIRLSRSKGGVVMLISQSPDDFEGVEDDFLNEMGLIVAFRTNADARQVRRILGPSANLATLERGHAWAKTSGETGARRVLAWR